MSTKEFREVYLEIHNLYHWKSNVHNKSKIIADNFTNLNIHKS
jgi:hypothetical protein